MQHKMSDSMDIFKEPVNLWEHNNKLCDLSQRANCTDSYRHLSEKLVSTSENRMCHVVSAMHPHGRILTSLDRSRYFFSQVAPQLYS
jgi:hypothetical protein